jgi:hypothetical protein
MPSKNDAQRRALEAKKGHAWVKAHHFDKVVKGGKSGGTKSKGKKGK